MKKIILPLLLLCVVLALTGCACKHAETQLLNVKEPNCTEAGYTGDTVCVKCKETVTAGETIAALGHVTQMVNQKKANCVNDGYTGDEVCTVCGETVVSGEVIPALGHGEIIVENAYESTCKTEGFSGMKICTVCSNIVEDGEFLPKLEHTPAAERSYPIEPDCERAGYTGNLNCAVCGEKLEDGENIPALGHAPGEPYNVVAVSCVADGYTGDRNCTVCEALIRGEVLSRLEHNWVDGVCADCGWMPAGMYVDGVLAMDWEKLVSGGYLTIEGTNNEILSGVQPALYGRLVIDESITSLDNSCFSDTKLDEVWMPCTMTVVDGYGFARSSVKSVRFSSNVTDIGYCGFRGATLLEEIIIPEGVTEIPDSCFYDCTSLKRVVLPSTLESIDNHAFFNCGLLTEISFPEGLKSIGVSAFSRSGLSSVTLPSTVEKTGMSAFNECPNLASLDLSATALTGLFEVALYNPSLKEVKLPHGLTSFNRGYDFDCPVEEIVLPDTLTEYKSNSSKYRVNTSMRSVVWPLSLKEASGFHYFEALETIYYKGSEFEWSLVNNTDGLGDVNVVFNYTGE